MTQNPPHRAAGSRRHDLDALRAVAMLMGIALHASLSFFPAPWPVQDSRQSAVFGLFEEAIHGFRMPLFFLISGYFTMMLYRKRGLPSLLSQRALRILVPCLIGVFTIVPLMGVASFRATASRYDIERIDPQSLIGAIRRGDGDGVRQSLDRGESLETPDPVFGIHPLHWAAIHGDIEIVKQLVDRGAPLDRGDREGNTPLHAAAFMGHANIVELLLEAGTNPNQRNQRGESALASAAVKWADTEGILKFLQLTVPDRSELESGREIVRKRLTPLIKSSQNKPPPSATALPPQPNPRYDPFGLLARYSKWLASPSFQVAPFGTPFNLLHTRVFDHLWFLWFLWWLVVGFALMIALAKAISKAMGSKSEGMRSPVTLPVVSELRYLWLIPLSYLPQWFTGIAFPHFGPDTSIGLIPHPHIFVYYAIFFTFGAMYFDADDRDARVGRGWWLLIPFGLLILFPIGLATYGHRPLNTLIQVTYGWTMTFGMIGLFHTWCRTESSVMRYLSDASYWMYLMHLPLIIFGQTVVRDWRIDPFAKFLLLNVATTAVLIVSYHLLVRYTWIGLLLNGPRKVEKPQDAAIQPA